MRILNEWDADYLDELIPCEETTNFEKKASDGFTSATIAKGVCALANSGGGFIAFGFKDEKAGNGLDAGVPSMNGRQPVKDWAEALIPKLHQPPIAGCEARFIQHGSHAADRGVLVIAVPLSERRPHWVKDTEKPYLRTGAHSSPMPMQIFADMLTRGMAPTFDVVDLGICRKGGGFWSINPHYQGHTFRVKPSVRLSSGPICEHWACELLETTGVGLFNCDVISNVLTSEVGSRTWYIRGTEPLFLGRTTPLIHPGVDFRLSVPQDTRRIRISLKLFAGSSPPIERQFNYSVESGELWSE